MIHMAWVLYLTRQRYHPGGALCHWACAGFIPDSYEFTTIPSFGRCHLHGRTPNPITASIRLSVGL
jgi:hypothetical protein